MNTSLFSSKLLSGVMTSLFLLSTIACFGNDENNGDTPGENNGSSDGYSPYVKGSSSTPGSSTSDPKFTSTTPVTLAVGATHSITIEGLNNDQDYRFTIYDSALVTPGSDPTTATFVPRENATNGAVAVDETGSIVIISGIKGAAGRGGTLPAGLDKGLYPDGGKLTFEVTAQGAGTVYPVIHHQDQQGTFEFDVLRVDENGAPKQVYEVGPAITVTP